MSILFKARELVLNCCTEFIHLISSESNEVRYLPTSFIKYIFCLSQAVYAVAESDTFSNKMPFNEPEAQHGNARLYADFPIRLFRSASN